MSGGNKRKLSVSLALIGGPSMQFFDEPVNLIFYFFYLFLNLFIYKLEIIDFIFFLNYIILLWDNLIIC